MLPQTVEVLKLTRQPDDLPAILKAVQSSWISSSQSAAAVVSSIFNALSIYLLNGLKC